MMWRRLGASTTLAFFAILAVVLPALAGGFAVTTFDQLPTTFRAGESYRLGYTVRQHGVTPVPGLTTRIIAQQAATGVTEIFAGTADGLAGHYAATVRLPSDGVWLWHVEQGPFAPQQLGTLTVLPSADIERVQESSSGGLRAALRIMLPVATLAALVVFGWRVLVLVKWMRPVAARRWPAS
jgi:ABC-type multidrug transport system fused ATPase/permease subunit